LPQYLNQQFFLVAEMVDNEALRYFGSSCDFFDRDTLIAFSPKQLFGSLEDRLIPLIGDARCT
jgi:hypothetical protein